MATYNTISRSNYDYDSTKKLQEMLNATGQYNLATDGIFGQQTEAAVRKYQTANGLDSDGIVGSKTWNALQGGGSSGGSSSAPAVDPMAGYKHTESDTVTQAKALLEQLKANKPGEFSSTWSDQLSGKIQEYLNMGDFQYDVNRDALYQQLKEQYKTMGSLAMQDTMGQAAALTGGYGNSWAQSAGQQAYHGYLQQLTQQVPELYSMARSNYDADRQAIMDQASLMSSMEQQDYQRYQDKLQNYYTELGLAADEAARLAETEYNRWWNEKQMEYQLERDKVADAQWQKSYDESVRQFNVTQASKGSGGGGSGSGTKVSYFDVKADLNDIINGNTEVTFHDPVKAAYDYLSDNKNDMAESDYNELKKWLDAYTQNM